MRRLRLITHVTNSKRVFFHFLIYLFYKRYFLLPLNPFPPCQYPPRHLEVEVVSGSLTQEGAGLCGALE